jgi:hypothetical protein
MALFYFDPNAHQSIEFLKEGRNEGVISAVDKKDTSSGTGQYIEVSVAFGGTTIKDRCNISNPNPNAVTLGLARLGDIYRAAGVGAADIPALVGKRVSVELVKELNAQTGKSYFEVAKWLPKGAPASPQQAQARPSQQQYDPRPQPPMDDIPPF